MKSIKSHFGVILSLFSLLFSIQFVFFVSSLINKYEASMKSEYNIVLVSKKLLTTVEVKKDVNEITSVTPIDTKNFVSKFRGKISNNSIELLSKSLPKFYNVQLRFFPNSQELQSITEKLKKVDGVDRVEVFEKTHDNIYRVLILIKSIAYVFVYLIVFLGLMLMDKQIRIWVFEHGERIEVMTLFGASSFSKSINLYRMAIVDSIIATLFVILFFTFLPKWNSFKNIMEVIGVGVNTISLPFDAVLLFIISCIISILGVCNVMRRIKGGNIR